MADHERPSGGSAERGEHGHFFEALGDHMGEAYLRYSFTRGTTQEVDYLWDALGLQIGSRLLDVGCGPGRHAQAFAERGAEVVGIDISQRFVDVATTHAAEAGLDNVRYERSDARTLAFDGEFDAAISLCQGAFGLVGGPGADVTAIDPDGVVLDRMAAAIRPGGTLAVSAFSAYFQVRYLEDQDTFDVATGVNSEETEVRNVDGDVLPATLWTSCFTPRELRLLVDRAGLTLDSLSSVTPGRYGTAIPQIDQPEFLVLAHR